MSKWTWFNANDVVRVKLTDAGRAFHRETYERLYRGLYPYRAVEEDADGWSEWQLHDLMHTFGPAMHMGARPPFETWFQFGKPEFPYKDGSASDPADQGKQP